MFEPVFMKLDMYIVAPDIHKSLPSLCVSVCISPSVVARQQLGRQVPVAKNTRNSRGIVDVVFYGVRVVSKENLWVSLCIPLSLLGNGSVNTFSRQRRIVGGVVFYPVRVVSKKSL
jgi:hypothetical protein